MTNDTLTEDDFTKEESPFDLFTKWLDDASASEINDPNAMALATVDSQGLPDVRMVLLKGFDDDGFVFYTNFESQKGVEILNSMKAALCFHWKTLKRQVRVRGIVEIVSDEEADAYYNSRARGSRIGAWASKQSRPLESRFALEKAVAEYGLRYAVGSIPRPPYWSGFRIRPTYIEFWHDRPFRLHDRLVFKRDNIDDENWQTVRLYP
ncbi:MULTISPECIES: pyridoxamine 5'-phosphate oxidase [unclassified Bartonella]|uniref:pyridoxamine 5'-phosphate oxidase n=1 Tax=unclassified Bartonella TaxID=2645622 RepID=UPI0021C92389|nr:MULTISPECIES: pyridoxamine 5'-phosphate oxidase [unclassified Bartonella]UXN03644.1 pyridoxamine 5'-phosphate oxidase [Bartonella sp. HY406]UXN06617.1 pyridoxamine 5'-phosphate oxidase [Bartonella sp. HY761]